MVETQAAGYEAVVERKRAHARRYREIASVLTRHGLGSLVGVLGLRRFSPLRMLRQRRPDAAQDARQVANASAAHSPPEHLRVALEELGATFIKLGQILSTRSDLLPSEYVVELAKLQDAAPEVVPEEVQVLLAEELGRPIEEVFAYFNMTPLAAASIGQAHEAALQDGTEVVVKIRRPGVVEQVEEDLEILQDLADAADRRWEFASQYDLLGLVQEFARTLRAELDYIREGHNAERFGRNFAGDTSIHIPRIFWETTTSQVLTLERIRGIKISDLEQLDAAGIDREALSGRAARLVLTMVFDYGLFHADPHPGNFFIEAGGRIGLIDFGMVGHLDDRTQAQLAEIVMAVSSRDTEKMVDALLEMGIAPGNLNRLLLGQDLSHMVSRYYGMELRDIMVGRLLNDALGVARRHRFRLPSNLALLIKTIIMSEGMVMRLDPKFNFASWLAPYTGWMMMRYYSPSLWGRRLGEAGLDVARLATEMPRQIRRIIGEVERGGLQVGMRPEGFDHIIRRLERFANRIVLGVLASAFINGLAILLSVYRLPGWEQWVAILFALGFAAAVALGCYLAWSVLRSGRG